MFDKLLRNKAKKDREKEAEAKAEAEAQEEAEAEAEARQLFKLLCTQAEAEARHFRDAGDLVSALAVYDSQFAEVRRHPRIVAKRAQIVGLLRRRAKHLEDAGDCGAALALYDALPPEIRETEFRQDREDILELLHKNTTEQARQLLHTGDTAAVLALYGSQPPEFLRRPDVIRKRAAFVRKLLQRETGQLRHTGDLTSAIAVYDRLPIELRDHVGILQDREDILELLRRNTTEQARELLQTGGTAAAVALYGSLPAELLQRPDVVRERAAFVRKLARREADQLRHADDFAGAIAVYDRLPIELRDHVDILQDRGNLLHGLGQLNAAREVFSKILSIDPSREKLWHALGVILADLGRSKELEAHIEGMVSKLPLTFHLLKNAARLAKRGMLLHLAGRLSNDALDLMPSCSASEIVKAAEELLQLGAHGRVINLLDNEEIRSDPDLCSRALDLSSRALDQLRIAGRPSDAGPVADAERADTLIVRSILKQAGSATPTVAPAQRGIAIVTNTLGAGGIQKQIVELIRQLCAAHRELIGPIVLLLESRSSAPPEFYESELAGLDVTIEFMSEVKVDPQDVLPAEMAAKLKLLTAKRFDLVVPFTSRLKAHNPEVVLVMMTLKSLPVVLAASLAGIPHIVASERSAPRLPDELLKLAYRTVIAQQSASVVTNSAATARDFAKWLDVSRDRVGVIYNGMNVDELRARRSSAAVAAYRRSLGIADGTRIVGSVFQARMVKRPQLWIEAAAVIARRAPDVAFIIVGGKLDRDDLSAMLVRHGLQTRFHRPGISKDVANWLSLMDLVLLTSQYEGTPNVLLEAQALGRPVVATDIGGNAETFLPGETGLLVSAHPTPEEIADAVVRVLDDPSFAARAEEKGPALIRKRFSGERMAAEFVDLCFGKCGDELPIFQTESPASAIA